MRKILVMMGVMVAISTAAQASITSILAHVPPSSASIQVDTTVTAVSSYWKWAYDVTPIGVEGVQAFSVYIGAAGISDLVGAPSVLDTWNLNGWTTTIDTTNNAVQWNANTATKLGPSVGHFYLYSTQPLGNTTAEATAQNGGIYDGIVPAPAVPEPMSILLGTLGLGAISGFRKLRRK